MRSKINYSEIIASFTGDVGTNIESINGNNIDVDNGNSTIGTQRVTLSDVNKRLGNGLDTYTLGTTRGLVICGVRNNNLDDMTTTDSQFSPITVDEKGRVNTINTSTAEILYKSVLIRDNASYKLITRSGFAHNLHSKYSLDTLPGEPIFTQDNVNIFGRYYRIPRNRSLSIASTDNTDNGSVTIYGYISSSLLLQNITVVLTGNTPVIVSTIFYSVDYMITASDYINKGSIWLGFSDTTWTNGQSNNPISMIAPYRRKSTDLIIIPSPQKTLYPLRLHISNSNPTYSCELFIIRIESINTIDDGSMGDDFQNIESYEVCIQYCIGPNDSIVVNCSNLSSLTRLDQTYSGGFMVTAWSGNVNSSINEGDISVIFDLLEK